jgi:plasmid maintenance system antidote protein VapI
MKRYPWKPDWITCPGETLAEWLDHVGISARVARRLCPAISEDRLERVLGGVEPITDELAADLEHMTGVPSLFWLRMEANYRNGLRAGLTHEHDT